MQVQNRPCYLTGVGVRLDINNAFILSSHSTAPYIRLNSLVAINNFQANFSDWWLMNLLRKVPRKNATGTYWWQVNIASGNGLVSSGNRSLPEAMLDQKYVATCRQYAIMCFFKYRMLYIDQIFRFLMSDVWFFLDYRQVSNIRRTKYQHLKDSHTALRLPFMNPLKPDVKSRMKM